MSESVQHGLSYGGACLEPSVIWFLTAQSRDTFIEERAYSALCLADNKRRTMVRLVRLPNGQTYAEVGAPALDVQWRPTCFRASHHSCHSYMDQSAVVDVVSGRVIVADTLRPYGDINALEYSKHPCLEEYPVDQRHAHRVRWPSLRVAEKAEQAHYMVADLSDLSSFDQTKPANPNRLDTASVAHLFYNLPQPNLPTIESMAA